MTISFGCDKFLAVNETKIVAGRRCLCRLLPVSIVADEEAVLQTAFFVPELLQEREQCRDCADEVENEVEPVKLVHDITPSLSRRKPSHLRPAAKNIAHFQKHFKR